MRHTTVAVLCLIAILAISAPLAASASAAKPTAGPLQLDLSGLESVLETATANIRCKGVDSFHPSHLFSEEIYNPTTGRSAARPNSTEPGGVLYEPCELEGTGAPCGKKGPYKYEESQFSTTKLFSDLAWISRAAGEVGIDFKPESGEIIAQFECKGLGSVKLYGALISGPVTPTNVMTTEVEVKFTSENFKNKPERFEARLPEALEVEINGAKRTAAGETRADHIKGLPVYICKGPPKHKTCHNRGIPPFEINTVASGTPEWGRCRKTTGRGRGKGEFTDPNCTSRAAKTGQYEFFPVPS